MEKKVNNRIKILNAAWKLFEEKGYERSTSPFAWDCAEIVTEGCKEIISKLK